MKIGIVGLPNVGKSTLFTALTKKEVPRENYPFCTIEPNVGLVGVPDHRLGLLAQMSKSAQILPTTVEFVDIAGLVKGASTGEGLGNKFLSHIKEVDAICHVVRAFVDSNIHHVSGKIDPSDDIETINIELIMSDLQLLEKRISDLSGHARTGDKESQKKLGVCEKIKAVLDQGRLSSSANLERGENDLIKDLNLLTQKPMLFVFNTKETVTPERAAEILSPFEKLIQPAIGLALNVQQEAELASLGEAEQKEFIAELKLPDSGLNQFIGIAYKLLDLVTFLTTGEKETRAWTVKNGSTAPTAAGKIHSDIERGFIRAEIVNWQELLETGSWNAAKEKGLIRVEGKDYIMREGDVCYFRFSV
ncbi:MAG: redox-regulated ATPase YchF [Candidatus Jacksonbacteria bacterium RIFOXYC2_FULL_44_29]|nr:MAG: GTP-binding protein YchF [Parcubacteria group bacterium GW2011_GWC2_44_22]OGY76038.1 MAG: redox-regulated ATPase YchF [Candidatus Jacksonbacteria bacterium RIFOXYA2_FULL_43_12]OGY76802.1 MAG: redox-regulated ATPase YchF [Candidatus Jacksonbacteria bacterium RIFOXYB2_FULL_44_15]OGY79207.1 MAG: redox-regulated ATPase YchF [Candidatus Jacksonbacteria bacterium RIFOXYC2_FULL_44_29]OGY82126.1 MAG: redox-regulated ATPase YchF [Candidatus Jacksonbacteria bacterium RIFOXYD2_FULL_43_21]HBH46897